MKNILELLYYGQINEAERSDNPHSHIQPPDEEDKAYDLLYASLSDKQKELFEKWEEHYANRMGDRMDYTFARGFKMGFHLALQVMDFDLP